MAATTMTFHASSMPVMTEVKALTSMIAATSTYSDAVDGTQLLRRWVVG